MYTAQSRDGWKSRDQQVKVDRNPGPMGWTSISLCQEGELNGRITLVALYFFLAKDSWLLLCKVPFSLHFHPISSKQSWNSMYNLHAWFNLSWICWNVLNSCKLSIYTKFITGSVHVHLAFKVVIPLWLTNKNNCSHTFQIVVFMLATEICHITLFFTC
jgi:hypothetical protein